MTIPCKDCITLGVCTAQFREHPKHRYRSAHLLAIKCSILTSHLNKHYYKPNTEYSFLGSVITFFSDNKRSNMIIPCKDCITFVMCKSKFKAMPLQPYTSSERLIRNCAILSTYLQQQDNIMEEKDYITKHNHVIDFFNKGIYHDYSM